VRLHPLAPVVALDIDGTLGDYYGHFKWFAELYLQQDLRCDWTGTTNFDEALNLDKETYRDIKLAYRQGGMKRSIPVLDGDAGRALIQNIRERLGVQVWICTTRPWQRLDNIDPDTQFWIQRNFGRVDGVIYGEDKYEDLIDIVGRDRILGVVDDLPENVRRAGSLGLRAAIRAGQHNAAWRLVYPTVPTIHHNSNIYSLVETWKDQKKNEH